MGPSAAVKAGPATSPRTTSPAPTPARPAKPTRSCEQARTRPARTATSSAAACTSTARSSVTGTRTWLTAHRILISEPGSPWLNIPFRQGGQPDVARGATAKLHQTCFSSKPVRCHPQRRESVATRRRSPRPCSLSGSASPPTPVPAAGSGRRPAPQRRRHELLGRPQDQLKPRQPTLMPYRVRTQLPPPTSQTGSANSASFQCCSTQTRVRCRDSATGR